MNQRNKGPFKIGIDARFYRGENGGLGRYTRELLREIALIDKVNEYVIFLTPDDVAEYTLTQSNFRSVVVPVVHFTPAEQTTFLSALNKEKLDLVHFLNFNHPLLYRRPFVTTLHDLTLFFFPAGKSKKSLVRRMLFRTVFKRALKGAKKVIAISEYSANDAEKGLGISHAKMEVVYEGGPDSVSVPYESKKIVVDYLGTKEPYFLFVSQWRPHKGILTLIEAFTEFKKRTGSSHKLILVGKQNVIADSVREALTQSPYASDIITPGYVQEDMLPMLYHHAQIFVMPSEYEGFGLPVLEAFTCATAVICAKNSSLPEVGGNAALYFETKNASALADRMLEVVSTPGLRDAMIEKGFKQLKKFSWHNCAKQTHTVYLSVLEKK